MPLFRPSLALVIGLALAPGALPDPGSRQGDAAAPPAVKRPARTDRFGDPLPLGALARFGTTRLRVGDAPQFLGFLPGGRTVISAAVEPLADQTHVCEWDVATGKRLRHFVCAGSVPAVALSPDGKTVALASYDRPTGRTRVRLWNLATGTQRRQLSDSATWVSAVVFAPDGTMLATAGEDKLIHLWDTRTGAELRHLTDGQNQWWRVRFSPDGKTLAAASDGRNVTLWDLDTSRMRHHFDPHTGDVTDISFAPNSRTLATAGYDDGRIRLWDRTTGQLVREWRTGKITNCIAFSSDGKTLARAGIDGQAILDRCPIDLRDLATGKERRLAGHLFGVVAVAFSPDGKTLASMGHDGVIRLWDFVAGRERLTFPGHGSGVVSIAFAPDARTVATGASDGTVRLWEAATGNPLRQIKPGGRVHQVVFSPDGTTLTAAAEGGPIRLWDPLTGKVVRRFDEAGRGHVSCLFAPDGRTLATGADDGVVRLWDVDSGKDLRHFNTDKGNAFAIGFSLDGKILVGGNESFNVLANRSGVSVWDVAAGKRIRHWMPSGSTWVGPFTLSPDGRTVAAGENWPRQSPVRAIHLWDLLTGKRRDVTVPQTTRMSSITFSPDGRTLAWGNEDGTVVLWEMATARPRRRFQAHPGAVLALAFSPDGRALASASNDTTALLRDVTGLADAGPLPPPSGAELTRLWTELGEADAERAYAAMWRLVATPPQSLPWLAEHLRPAAAADPQRVARLIDDLGNPRFPVRTKATRDLERLGESAVPLLRKALAGQPAPDVRRRLEQLLEKQQGPATGGDELRSRRAVEVLEHIGSDGAQRLLEKLASGVPDARLTVEAKVSLARLARRFTPAR